MKKILLIIAISILVPIAFAKHGGMPLLAVREKGDSYEGSTAKLFLEISPGSGRVFVDTFPLSKIDTQISMRFAKEIACDFLDHDCENLDFIYTIRASSPIIGGPSAGAAAAILTITTLSDAELKHDVSITGTINSGGLIGPVGGLKEKIAAGADSGLKFILIPEGEYQQINKSGNDSISTQEYAKQLGVEAIEVSDIYQTLPYFTDTRFKSFKQDIMISSTYKNTMKELANILCQRNMELKRDIFPDNSSRDIHSIYEDAKNLSIRGEQAFQQSQYYSAASFCFSSNIKYNNVFLEMKNFSDTKYDSLFQELKIEIDKFESEIEEKKIKTITDLESYMVVKERLIEAREYAENKKNNSFAYAYAYANERLRSAYSWATFFNHQGKELNLDEESLKESCRQRIAESEERLQYASIYLPFSLTSPRDELDKAYEDFNNADYALCLFKASKSKAESNIVLNTLGIGDDFIPKLIENKLDAATRVIVKAEQEQIFPILGYSYFEYANNLKSSDRYSALLYSEYALELSNLDIYFQEKSAVTLPKVDNEKIILMVILLKSTSSQIPIMRFISTINLT
jgi:uncharacterized protein